MKTRKARNRELAEREALNRCAKCKRPLAEVEAVYEDFLHPGKFCSDECLTAYLEFVRDGWLA